jgi:hypothetical protein
VKLQATLYNAQQGHKALQELWAQCKALLMAEHQLSVTVKPMNRTLGQNAKFHALCTDIAKSGATWAGKRRTTEQWKVLMVSGHAVATKAGAEMVPGLEGELVNLRESTAQMSVKRSSSLIEYTLAWCATNDVRLPALE